MSRHLHKSNRETLPRAHALMERKRYSSIPSQTQLEALEPACEKDDEIAVGMAGQSKVIVLVVSTATIHHQTNYMYASLTGHQLSQGKG